MRAHYQLLNQSRVHMTIDRHTIAPQRKAILELDMTQDLVNQLAKQNIEVHQLISGVWVGWLPRSPEQMRQDALAAETPVVAPTPEPVVVPVPVVVPEPVAVVIPEPEVVPEPVVVAEPEVEHSVDWSVTSTESVVDEDSVIIAPNSSTEEVSDAVDDVKPGLTEDDLANMHHKKRQKIARDFGVDDSLPKNELIAAIIAAQE